MDNATIRGCPTTHAKRQAGFWDNVADAIECGEQPLPPLEASWFRNPGNLPLGVGILGDIRGLVVAELGCGPGRILRQVAEHAALAIGVDFSRGQLRLAGREVAFPNARLIQHDLATGMPGDIPPLDLVYSVYGAFDFVPEPQALMQKAWIALRESGRLFILSSHLPLPDLAKILEPAFIELFHDNGDGHSVIYLRKR